MTYGDRRRRLPDRRLRAEGRRPDLAPGRDTRRSSSRSPSSRRTAAGRATRTIPRTRRRRSPAPRHRNRFANEPLPTPPSFNEADVSDKPAGIRNRALLGAGRINAIRENYQQRLESLLAVDEAVAQIVNQLAAIGELDKTYIVFTSDNGFFHGEHRVPAGKVLVYEPSVRVPLIIRGPGVPAGQRRSQFVGEHRPRADDPRRGERPSRAAAGRPLAAAVRARRAAAVGPRHPAGDAELQRDSHAALRVRPARERRAGALRPRPRSAPASEPARGWPVHVREERPRCPARASPRMCRRRVSSRAESSPPGALSARPGRLCPLDRSASRGRFGRVEDLERELLPRPREDQARLEGAVHGVGFAARAPHADARAGTRRASRLAQHDARSRSASLLAARPRTAGGPAREPFQNAYEPLTGVRRFSL